MMDDGDELEALVPLSAGRDNISEKRSKDGQVKSRSSNWLVIVCLGTNVVWGITAILLIVVLKHQQQHSPQTLPTELYSSDGKVTDLFSSLSASNKQEPPKKNLTEWYQQDRPLQRLGRPEDGYVPINTHNNKVAKRIEDMRILNQVRFGHCGRFDEYLEEDGSKNSTTHWKPNIPDDSDWSYSDRKQHVHHFHCPNGEAFRKHRGCTDITEAVQRHVCEAPHPTMLDVTVTIERFGPFTGTGNNDWTTVNAMIDVGGLEDRMRGKDMAYVGGMAVPIHANGTIIGYPPLHLHHAHVHPHASRQERSEKIFGNALDYHSLILQAHGDTECHADEGGVACLLEVLAPQHARVVEQSDTGLLANFVINDMRPDGSDVLEYWFEIVLLFTVYDAAAVTNSRRQRTTHIGLNNPCVGPGPCTYAMPYDPHTNVMVYNYTHGTPALLEDGPSHLSSGYMSNFIWHSHQTLADSAFVFHSTDGAVLQALYEFRRDRDLPLILECREDAGQVYDLEAAKQELFRRVAEHGGTLVCETTRPSLHIVVEDEDAVATQTNQTTRHHRVYDKRSRLQCVSDPVRLNVGDVLTVLAFNVVRPHPDVSRCHNAHRLFRQHSAFDDQWTVPQHSVFRFDLSYDEPSPEYIPPAFFHFSTHHPSHTPDLHDFDDLYTGCPKDGPIQYQN